ncbi:sialidase [Sphingobacterium sp. UT-1RO-CII-1]|uniref:alpha/beta hydrolase family protein n=1 Tax=Sphingobacterium sp. UT-1RO-CII-1 TaxID=2995225 RepID=UPI00227B0850|nr:alpha/beta hydrolase family protein [Sphingobacterium sp. UT-1RO-CII-1]MCY4779030.1 sialidase [Sphingobacterium sp. UT-1RO-CII-1]
MKANRLILCILILLGSKSFSQDKEIPAGIAKYFVAPDSLKENYGDYRSPLIFNNGEHVQTIKQWELRKAEIRRNWEHYLGKWPALDEEQKFEYLDSIDKGNYMQYTVRFKWTPQEWTKGYLLIPKELEGEKPAVVSVFYDAETSIGIGSESRPFRPWRDFATQLVNRGFVTLSIGTKEASERNEFSLYYPSIDNVSVQPLSMLGYAANSAYHVLANHKEVNKDKIGIVGHSFGGKWAMFASCLTDNFAAAAWSDPGVAFQEDRESINYWEPWYLGYHPKPWRKRGLITEDNPAFGVYEALRNSGHNLQELHALMAPRPFLVSGGAEDPVSRWRVLNHAVQVNKLLGFENRVAMTNRPMHALTQEASEAIYSFFTHFLK